MLVLHAHPVSPFAQKVMIALAEKGVAYESRVPDFVAGDMHAFAKMNPRLEAPVLVDGDTVVFDSTIILEYIEERWPSPPLLPVGAAARARVRMIEEICDTYYEPIVWGLLEVQGFQRVTGEAAKQVEARAAKQLAGVHGWLERQLGDQPFFNGASFGWGDLAVAPFTEWAVARRHPPTPGSRLAAWFARIGERPTVAPVLKACRDLVASLEPGLPQWIAGGPFKREYRDQRLDWVARTCGLEVVAEGLAKGNVRFTTEIE
jgi:glutathione S-transferase/RNA polymerase-associated protein